ncbi:MAG: threonine/serine exporter family protein [Paraclostridium sp.]
MINRRVLFNGKVISENQSGRTVQPTAIYNEKIAYMNQKQSNYFLESILGIGKLMIEFGSEIWKIEDSLSRICKAYNINDFEIYASTTLILATIRINEDIVTTQSIRVGKASPNLGGLEELNSLSRYICFNKPNIEDIKELTKKSVGSIKLSHYNGIGYILAAGAFAVFFGGSYADGLVAGVIGGIVYLMDRLFKVEDGNRLIITAVMSFIAGMITIVCVELGLGNDSGKIIIGVAMLFVSTLALVNGVKDMFYRNIMSGCFRVIESLLGGAAMATGFGLSIALSKVIL